MGREQRYQALPPGCGLVEMACADLAGGEYLGVVPIWFRRDPPPAPGRTRPGPRDPLGDPYWELCCRLAGEYPELAKLNCDLDRRFDILDYLLCAGRRGDEPGGADRVLTRVFESGADIVADHVRATQGRLVRFVPAGVVRDASALLAQVTPADLRRHYDATRMVAAGVYKCHLHYGVEEMFADAVLYFGELRRFMLATAGAGFDAILVID